ncbi:MAG: DUF86 domain-containing protein [Deltaproteobacteria bacterium]|nr:DUF86 domain-containing protein [Deltaproteobacteria bacterium]
MEVVKRKLGLLAEYLKDLKEYERVSYVQYTGSKMLSRYIERTLHLAIEVCLDIASHIISIKGFREAKDNKDMFEILTEEGIIPEKLKHPLTEMAKFRNIIVHGYEKIDAAYVVKVLQKDLKDFDAFAESILELIDKEKRI